MGTERRVVHGKTIITLRCKLTLYHQAVMVYQKMLRRKSDQIRSKEETRIHLALGCLSRDRCSKWDDQQYGAGAVGTRTHQRAVRRMELEIQKSHFASLDAIETEEMETQEGKESDGRNGDLVNPKFDKVGTEVWVRKKVMVTPKDVEASTSYSKGKKNKKGGAKNGQTKAKINGLGKEGNSVYIVGAHTKQQSDKERVVRTSG